VATLEDLLTLDVRVGTIVAAQPLRGARRPMLVLTLDFGALGRRQGCVDSSGREASDDLVGLQVAAVVNLPSRRVAGLEVGAQVLAVNDLRGESVLLLPERPVEDGAGLEPGFEAS
jgi:tRNA-binding protein